MLIYTYTSSAVKVDAGKVGLLERTTISSTVVSEVYWGRGDIVRPKYYQDGYASSYTGLRKNVPLAKS